MKHFIDTHTGDVWVSQDAARPPVMVILDAGHGGMVNGFYTTAPAKMYDHGDFVFYEGVYNREVVGRLSKAFIAENISHGFTTISNEDDPLPERIKKLSHIIKTYPKHHHMLMSIHGNAAGIESAKGFEFFSTPGITDSDFAGNFYVPYIYELGMKFRINRAQEQEYDKESNFYIIRKAEELNCISLLFETGFFTNKEEALRMLTPEWQEHLVTALTKGTVDVISKIQRDGTVREQN